MWAIGMVGSLAFSINLLPILIKCYKTHNCDTITESFLGLAYAGNICSGIFVFYTDYITGLWQYPIFFNYGTALTLTILLNVLKNRYKSVVKPSFFEEMYVKTIDNPM